MTWTGSFVAEKGHGKRSERERKKEEIKRWTGRDLHP